MSTESKTYLTFGGVGLLVLIILYLLHRQAPLTISTTTTPAPNQPPVNNIAGNTYGAPNLGDISLEGPTNLALNLSFPANNYGTTGSCDCGCDTNSPVNVALQNVATTINQYNQGILAITDGFIKQAENSIPDWMQQYINSGGDTVSGFGPGA